MHPQPRQEESIILVDEYDQEIGTEEKLKAHQHAKRHRAFSIFIFRQKQRTTQLLLQQRQQDKYHCGGLWTNTCCSHPRKGETTLEAARRRLVEEMGFSATLHEVGCFEYKISFTNGLTEHEIVHVFIGRYNGAPICPNEREVAAFRWVSIAALHEDLRNRADRFTPWFQQGLGIALANHTNL